MAENKPGANIMDHKPFVNVPPFAMCKSPNAHALSTGKAVPWTPDSSTVMIANFPALNNTSDACALFLA